jgi:DNA repair exonuclease SbcCD ATPase subunit
MYIKKLTVLNVGPHKKLEIDFKCGLVGIVGRNGCGKSTVVNLLYAVLTNDWSRFEGVKADCINNQAKPTDKAFAEIEVEHNNVHFKLCRSLRPNKSVFTYADTPGIEITNSEKIAEELKNILGVEFGVLDRFVFKQQHLIYDFLAATDGDRKKAFQKLCGTEHCETVWLALGRFILSNSSSVQTTVDNSDQLMANIASLTSETSTVQEKIDECTQQVLSQKTLLTLEAIVRAFENLTTAQATQKTLTDKIETASTKLVAAKQAVTDAVAHTEKIKERLTKIEEQVTIARDAKTAWRQYETVTERRKAAEAKVSAAQRKLDALTPPEDVSREQYDQLKEEQQTRLARVAELTKILDTFENTKKVVCPTCLTPVDSLQAQLVEYRRELLTLTEACTVRKKTLQALQQALILKKTYEDDLSSATAAHASATAVLDNIPVVEEPLVDLEDAITVLDKYEKYKQALSGAEADERIHEIESTRASSLLSALSVQLKDVETTIKDNTVVHSGTKTYTVTEDLVDHVTVRRRKHYATTVEIAKLEGLMAANQKNIQRYERDLDALRMSVKRNKKMRQLLSVLEQVRTVVHRDKLPNIVAVANMERMEQGINDNLAKFGSPFWVETAHDDLTFIVHKPGEPPQAAGRLSTGQKVILAIAFWLSLASVVGLLALDEPTANLDEDNRSFLADALSSLSTKISGHRQIIMVTHADNLRGCFDQIITLG